MPRESIGATDFVGLALATLTSEVVMRCFLDSDSRST